MLLEINTYADDLFCCCFFLIAVEAKEEDQVNCG
jgi:hypothetical protein